MGAGTADLHGRRGGPLQLRRAGLDQADPGGTGAGEAGGPDGAQPEPGQLLRRDGAGGVLHGARRFRASTSATIRCWRGASIPTSTRRSRGSAGRTSTRSRSTPRWQRCTTTSATGCTARRSTAGGCHTSRTRSEVAVHSRRAPMGFTSVQGADGGGQGAGQAGEVRGALPAGATLLRQPVGSRAAAHHRGVPVRALEGDGAGDQGADGRVAGERVTRTGEGRGGRARHGGAGCPAPRDRQRSQAGSEDIGGAFAHGACRATAGSVRGRSRC